MKEYERIVSEGWLPSEFLQPQIICDHFVDEKTKKIWAVELDLLREFDRACKKHGLRYFAFGGTILGAIRHGGFIPWDDDIDLAMPMDDYLRLQEIAKDEFHDPYVLQTPYLDTGSFFSFIKLRNSRTTSMSKVFSAQSFNQGAFIDIFPLVECPPEEMASQRARLYPSIMRCSNYMKRGCEDLLTEEQFSRFLKYSTVNPLEEYDRIMEEFCNPKYKGCGYFTHASLFLKYDEYHYWKQNLWERPVECKFENTVVPLPNGWKEIMIEYYGDFMVFPPVEQRVSYHSNMIIDMDKPYTEYIRK